MNQVDLNEFVVGKVCMSLPYPGPAYRIHTPRTVVRCYNPTDAALLIAAVDESRDHLRTFLPWADRNTSDLLDNIQLLRTFRGKFDLGQDFAYGIFSPDETRLLGGTGLHTRVGNNAREIGYWIRKDAVGQGLATEISAALTKVAFEIDQVQRVEIHCAVENKASAAVPRKLGYTLDGTLRKRILLVDEQYHDTMIWSLLREDYAASPSAQAQIEAFDAAGRKIL